jgi:hypothetical protein
MAQDDRKTAMKKRNKIVFIIVMLLVVLFGVGQFFSFSNVTPANQPVQNQTNNPSATQVIAYAPSVSSSTPVESGSCWTSSIAAPYRKDAWRCAVGNGISDPCFKLPAAPGSSQTTYALCGVNPDNPNSTSTFILRLTKPLPAPESLQINPPSNWAWLVELSDGTLCSPFTGTRPFAAGGESANYGCAPGPLGKDILIFGDLNASSSVWTAKIGTLSVSTSTFPPAIQSEQEVNVKAVWQ